MITLSNSVKKNLSLAWPLALNSLLVQSLVLVDLLLIAPLGEIPINALGVATAILAFLIGTQFALSNGTQMLLARAVGENNPTSLNTTLASGWLINVVFSSTVFCILLASSKWLLSTVVSTEAVALDAHRYLVVGAFILLFSSFSHVLIVYFNAHGKTKIPLIGFLIEIPFNVVTSAALIYGWGGLPELGLQGAAFGSFIATLIRLAYLLIRIKSETHVSLRLGLTQQSLDKIKHHLHTTLPIAANFVTLTGGMMVYQLLFAQLTVYTYAAIALIMPWMRMGAQFINAWAHATAIHISQYIGAKESELIPNFVKESVWITLAVALVMCFVFWAFSFLVPWLYPSMAEETLVALAVIAPIYILMPLLRNFNTLCGHSLRALGLSVSVLKIHVVTQWCISLPLLALLIYLQAPLLIVFGITLFEEALKTWKFRSLLKRELDAIQHET